MNVKKLARVGVAFALGLTAILGAGAVAANAKVLYRDSFEKAGAGGAMSRGAIAATPHGKGWHADYSKGMDDRSFQGQVIRLDEIFGKKGHRDRGTLVMWIQRNELEGTRSESVFSITDSSFTSLMDVTFSWEWKKRPRLITVESLREYPLWGMPYKIPESGGGGVGLSRIFPMPAVRRGEWFTLVMTWGPSPNDCAVYVDGKKIRALPLQGFAMKRILEDATYLLVGAIADVDRAQLDISSTRTPRQLPEVQEPMRSLIDAVEIHDEVVRQFPATYAGSDAVEIASVTHDAFRKSGFSGKLVAGDTLEIEVKGTSGATGTFDVAYFPDLDRKIDLDWSGWGVYLEEKTFYEEHEVNLRDVEGYKVYAARKPFDIAAPGMEPVKELDVKEQAYALEALETGTPYYVAVLAKMRDGSMRTVMASPMGLPLAESAPDTYTGQWKVSYQDRYPRAVIVAHLKAGDASLSLAGDFKAAFGVDPAVRVAVATKTGELRADEKSTAKISVTLTDANGSAVSGHKVKFLLATTSQYTGVVGGGAFAEQVGGAIKESTFGVTDLFGNISANYVAGFAAKTAIIVARDMESNATGATYIKTFIQAGAQLELEPVRVAARLAGYRIEVTSSDEWLTADGRSQARITARVTLGGQPVEGHQVNFAVPSGNGTVQAVKGTTDRNGESRALYTAGKKIGMVFITATDVTAGITGSVRIELRSDAPAKIKIKIDPEKLPADGNSRADLVVQVTDINDNPNDNVEVEYALTSGDGRLRDEKDMTNRRGESSTQYTAGRSPGMVNFEITVRSTVPSEEEMGKAESLAKVVPDSRFY